MLNVLANAAPSIPYFGISKRLRKILKIKAINNIFWNTFWQPVIWRITPTEPEIEETNFPTNNINNTVFASINSSPKKDKTNSGKIYKINTI